MSSQDLTRRAFLAATTTSALAVISGCATTRVNGARVVPKRFSPNQQLNIAGIGAGGQAAGDIQRCMTENIVALADPDWGNCGPMFELLPDAKKFKDYRVMLEQMPEIDACIISTPDHTHAPAAYRAMKLGKHVYVQKPLTHTVAEARLLQRTAQEMGVVTQMGNQGHSGDGVRELCEMLWDGAIGGVTEAHTWTDRPIWPQGFAAPLPGEPVPDTMDWDLWIGSARMRPYNPGYAPFKWRGWWEFGCGALGDMACHVMDPAWWALKLGEAGHYQVEVVMQEGMTAEGCPLRSTIKYDFPARAGMPPVTVYWYDGFWGEGDEKRYNRPARPEGIPEEEDIGGNGSLFYGSDGILSSGTYGGNSRLLPVARMEDYTMPEPYLTRVPEGKHDPHWVRACKGLEDATSDFD